MTTTPKELIYDEDASIIYNESQTMPNDQDEILDGHLKNEMDEKGTRYTSIRGFDGMQVDQAPCLASLGPYPSWNEHVPITQFEIKHLMQMLVYKFGFQQSSMDNMYDHLLTQLDSRASRLSPLVALTSLHASYIGGENSNYKKWFFAAQLDLDEEVGFSNMKLHGKAYTRNKKIAKQKNINMKEQRKKAKEAEEEFIQNKMKIEFTPEELERNINYKIADYKWKQKMNDLTSEERIEQIALYLLIWGEANQAKFLPEYLCFIFKCALDYHNATRSTAMDRTPEFTFLNDVITPIYNFLRGQLYSINSDGKLIKKEKDHKDIIGYDDVNQLFWYPEGIERIKLKDSGERIVDIPLKDRYSKLKDCDWNKAFYKTYLENRTWLHLATNFNRIWVIHLTSFWFFTSFNSPTLYTKDYDQLIDNQPVIQSRLSAIALGGTVACLIQLIATVSEWFFVPRAWPGAQRLTKRFILLLIATAINVAPSILIFSVFDLETHSIFAYYLSLVQLIVAITTAFWFAFVPLGKLFSTKIVFRKTKKQTRKSVSSQTFTAAYPQLIGRSRAFSIMLWVSIFTAKFLESYFFLTLSIRDPIRNLSIMNMTRCVGDQYFGKLLCSSQAIIVLGLILFTDLVLFFLDTYLWYIVINCCFSVALSFVLGISILSPWRNVFSRLPKRIYSKIIATSEMEVKYKPKILVSQVWNAIVISMYREHLLPVEMVHKLLYQQVSSEIDGKKKLKSPSFFVAHDDSTFKSSEFFPANSEAERRISFFAQSLSTPIPEPIPVESMPVFTVLIPHYGEKILLSLKEIIKEDNTNSRITLLEYLKQLYPTEWDCFVKDTKLLAIESGALKETSGKYDTTQKLKDFHLTTPGKNSDHTAAGDSDSVADVEGTAMRMDTISVNEKTEEIPFSPIYENVIIPNSLEDNIRQCKIDDLPLYCIGFKTSSPEYSLRTRIWASLRTQTLYRTASGFQNYVRALKLLYRIENPAIVQFYYDNPEGLDVDLEAMAHRKFKLVIAMQRYTKFNIAEREDTDLLLTAYPDIKIAYLEEETDQLHPDGPKIFYSCLIDGFSERNAEGERIPRYRVRLSGNPILGDGKSDNQNHALIFYRGEYIQVIDANQDNYLEECIKIRSILAEFEEIDLDATPPYVPGIAYTPTPAPIAIVGAREYIFSENIGVLGDVAAGKEQTFGTLFARTLAEIGGKLHYGHPDFLNAIFMTTRGGISKSQKGLHLNEDIYAGMTALLRGGRIKHSDYYQCGKGRDLGFGSILNFTTKIGAGMGEQILSREYYYLGTQLPIDRFLSFYYAHAGFHINNLFIVLSVQMFMIVLVNLGALVHESTVCHYNKDTPFTDLQRPIGCYNLQPILNWVTIFVLSVFIVFFIAFIPLLVQELTERGLWKATSRFFHHLMSLSPFFEVFVCQIYATSLIQDVTFGGAKYISTGRGLAVSRIQFFYLYSRFANQSIYSGSKMFLMLLFATSTIWQPSLLWFWITVISMCLAPFIFNPHQFSFYDYFVDYRDFIHWLSRGNSKWHANSWISTVRQSRARYTGYKRSSIGHESENSSDNTLRKSQFKDTYLTELIIPLIVSVFLFSAYTFINAQNGVKNVKPTNSVLRLIILTLFPLVLNMITLLVIFSVSFVFGPILKTCCCLKKAPGVFAASAHTVSVILYLITFEIIWFLEDWNFARALSCILAVISIQDFIFKFITIMLLSRELKHDKINRSWWSGTWFQKAVGWRVITQPLREYIVKIMEMSLFAADFILGHSLLFIQTPLVFVPYIDRWHTMILFWLGPKKQIKGRVLSKAQKRRRLRVVLRYTSLYFTVLSVFMALLIAPIFTSKFVPTFDDQLKGTVFEGLIQPNNQDNDDTGKNAPSTIITTTGTRNDFKTVTWFN
ncbi:hypothetical protein WICMUC_003099 [Wickerhamomyces mucosus]|uniref:1,3-beta-glucan synthase n=1 Tax=Wickerhamomyces mucosus TaxID=1378264 RepID=A0A9P8PLY3_9ASCO|nr:hypothetical protein WICMUC_003099 [Wickerhamomyces mucosus]